MVKDFPGDSVVKTGLPLQGVRVQPLVGEVKSPCAMQGRRERKEGRRGRRVKGRQKSRGLGDTEDDGRMEVGRVREPKVLAFWGGFPDCLAEVGGRVGGAPVTT